MGKSIIIYKSKTGFTKQYAEWIREELICDITSFENRTKVDLYEYDTIIYSGAFYAGKINGLNWFKKQVPKLEGKKLVVLAVGASPADFPDVQNTLNKNFTEEESKKVKTFYVQAGLSYEKMGAKDRFLMAGLRKMLKKQDPDSEMYKMILKSFDVSSRDFILPLVSYCSRG